MKKLGIVLLIVLLVLAAYWLYFKKMPFNLMPSTDSGTATGGGLNTDEATAKTTGSSVNGAFISTGTVIKDAYGFPLSEGSTGKYVSAIQKALNDRFNSDLAVDGIFGTKTTKALSSHGFNPTAIYWKHYYEILGVKI